MRIGEAAEAAGVAAQTIRFYERRGLLPQPPRGPNGYRDYDASVLNRLAFIRSGQAAGLTLVEVARLDRSSGGDPEAGRSELAGIVAALKTEARKNGEDES